MQESGSGRTSQGGKHGTTYLMRAMLLYLQPTPAGGFADGCPRSNADDDSVLRNRTCVVMSHAIIDATHASARNAFDSGTRGRPQFVTHRKECVHFSC